MPCNYKRDYHPLWLKEIRPAILKRARNRCECCRLKNGTTGYRDATGKFYSLQYIDHKLEIEGIDLFDTVLSNCFDSKREPTKPLKIVLTIAHLDHDTRNNDPANLKAMCSRCHFHHDKEQHKRTRERNKGLQSLF